MTNIKNKCWCGTATKTPHEIAHNGCVRYLVTAPTRSGAGWIVDGRRVTNFTLRQQRGYAQHLPSGDWSRSPGSHNSLPDET